LPEIFPVMTLVFELLLDICEWSVVESFQAEEDDEKEKLQLQPLTGGLDKSRKGGVCHLWVKALEGSLGSAAVRSSWFLGGERGLSYGAAVYEVCSVLFRTQSRVLREMLSLPSA